MLLVQQDIFQYLSLEHALDEDEDVDENVSNLVFIQNLHQIIEHVKFFSFYACFCIKCIKDKDKGLAISYTVLPYCSFRHFKSFMCQRLRIDCNRPKGLNYDKT